MTKDYPAAKGGQDTLPGAVAQIFVTLVYVALATGLVFLLDSLGVSENVRVTIVIAEAAFGLWVAVWLVGVISWPVLTALALLIGTAGAIFAFG